MGFFKKADFTPFLRPLNEEEQLITMTTRRISANVAFLRPNVSIVEGIERLVDEAVFSSGDPKSLLVSYGIFCASKSVVLINKGILCQNLILRRNSLDRMMTRRGWKKIPIADELKIHILTFKDPQHWRSYKLPPKEKMFESIFPS